MGDNAGERSSGWRQRDSILTDFFGGLWLLETDKKSFCFDCLNAQFHLCFSHTDTNWLTLGLRVIPPSPAPSLCLLISLLVYILPPLPNTSLGKSLPSTTPPLKLKPVLNRFTGPSFCLCSLTFLFLPPLRPWQQEVVSAMSSRVVLQHQHLFSIRYIKCKCLFFFFLLPRPRSLALWRLRPLQPGIQTYWQVSESQNIEYYLIFEHVNEVFLDLYCKCKVTFSTTNSLT